MSCGKDRRNTHVMTDTNTNRSIPCCDACAFGLFKNAHRKFRYIDEAFVDELNKAIEAFDAAMNAYDEHEFDDEEYYEGLCDDAKDALDRLADPYLSCNCVGYVDTYGKRFSLHTS